MAPFGGPLTVNLKATRAGAAGGPIRVELYLPNEATPRFLDIQPNVLTQQTVANVSKTVSAGERIYVRLVDMDSGDSAGALLSTSIKYAVPAGRSETELDPSGSPIFNFVSGNDYRVSGQPRVPWWLTANGTIKVARCFWKSVTSDDVKVSYVFRDKLGTEVRRFDKVFAAATWTQSTPVCFDNNVLAPLPTDSFVSAIGVTADQSVSLEFTSDTPVDPLSISVRESDDIMKYTTYCRISIAGGQACGNPVRLTNGDYTTTNDPWPKFPIPAKDITFGRSGGSNQMRPFYQPHVLQTFNNNNPTTPQVIRNVWAPSTSITFGGTVTTTAALTEDVVVLIQGVNKLHKKVRIPAGTASGVNTPVTTGAITMTANELIYFTIHSATGVGGNNVTWSATMNGASVASLNINKTMFDPVFDNNRGTSRDPMAGGFRRWFYGDWNHSVVPFSDAAIVRTSAPPNNADPVMVTFPLHDSDHQWWEGRGGSRFSSFGGTDYYAFTGRVNDPAATATSARSMEALRVSDSWNVMLTATAGGINAGAGGGDATTQVDFFDFDGDRFPDSITRSGVQYNNGVNAFSTRRWVDMTIGGPNELRRIVNANLQAGISVSSSSRQMLNETEGDGTTKKIGATVAMSGSTDYGVSSTRIDFADVNGDGLVDHVRQEPADGRLRVKLNLGYGFSKEVSWTTANWIQPSTTVGIAGLSVAQVGQVLNLGRESSPGSTNVVRLQDTATVSASAGLPVGFIGGGGGPTWSVTRKWVDLIDVNGDGLPDQVMKVPGETTNPRLRVKLNTGTGFAAEKDWTLPNWTPPPGGWPSGSLNFGFLPTDGLGFSTIDGWGKNFNVQVCFVICGGASGFASKSLGGSNADFEDVDGDGKLDQVLKVSGDSRVFWKKNNIGKTNLLSAVNRPLGSRIEISYARAGNHVEMMANPKTNMPFNQWVMSRADLHSGNGQSWDALTREEFDYSNWQGFGSGYYDKDERENLGYGSVKTIFPLEDVGRPAIEVIYLNQNYYERGLETVRRWLQNTTDTLLLKTTETRYGDPSGKSPAQELPRIGSYFPAPKEAYERSYEGGFSPQTHALARTYDANGNLTDVIDYGTDQHHDPNDDFNYHIDYVSPGTNITAAKTITVTTGQVAGAGTLLAKRTVDTFFATGKPNTVTDVIVGGKHPTSGLARTVGSPGNATWTFTYDAFGNVDTVKSPNSTSDPDGSARTLKYTYDTATRTYPVTTAQDEPGDATLRYTATAVYDPKFGLPTRITDVAGAKQEIDYDVYGRITKVWAPNDFDSSGNRIGTTPTIAVTYSQFADTPESGRPVPAWAMVTHRSSAPPEGSVPGATVTPRNMRTVNFVDGLERSIQVKKDISRDDGSGTSTAAMSVSGRTIFDGRGRVYQQGQPTFTDTATPNAFVTVVMNYPTEYSYDVLGRLRREVHPDNGTQAATFISYQMGSSPIDGLWYLKKVTADPLYSLDQTYHHRTEYVNARGEVKLVAERNQINWNPADLFTMYDYDQLGRVVRVMDVKGFQTSAKYDTVGNLVELNSPDAGIREWRYCVGGYVCAEQSPKMRLAGNSVRIQHTYDRDRLMTTTYPNPNPTSGDPIGNPGVTYVYGASTETGSSNFYKANRVKQRTDEAGRFDYEYDALGNVSKETVALKRTGMADYPSYATQYKWDNFGRLIDVTIPGTTSLNTPGETIRYGYDAGGAVASAIGKLTTTAGTTFQYVKHVGYNEFGERVRILYGNDAFSTYGYAADTRRLTNVDTTITDIGGQRLAQKLVYSYNLVGNVIDRLQSLPLDEDATAVPVGGISNQWFSYDPLNQLTSAGFYARGKVTEQFRGSVQADLRRDRQHHGEGGDRRRRHLRRERELDRSLHRRSELHLHSKLHRDRGGAVSSRAQQHL